MKHKDVLRELARVLLLAIVFAVPAWAAGPPLAPIEFCNTDQLCAPTALTEPGGNNPIAVADLPSMTSAELASKLSDESGSGGGFVRATDPSVSGGTFTGSPDFTGATPSFGTGANAPITAIGQLATGVRSGPDGTTVATVSGSIAEGNIPVADANGDLVDGGAPGGTAAIINFESQFPLPGGDVDSYVSAGSNISGTDAGAQSLAVENMTLGSPCCWVWTTDPGTGVVVTLQSGTYGGSLTPSSVTVTLATANTPVCDSSNSLAITAGQGYNVETDGASDTVEGQLRGGCKRTA